MPDARRTGPGIALWAILAVFAVVNLRWIWLYRYDQPLDIDEAGYMAMAVVDYVGLAQGGFSGFLSAVFAPNVQAPVAPALAGLLFGATGPHVVVGFAVPLAAGMGVIAASYALGVAVASRWAAAVAALLVASCPLIVNYSRDFHFSIPVTFVTCMALLALIRSDGFSRTGWSVAFGLFLGLMPMTRSMTIAFVPGMVVAALLTVLAAPAARPGRLIRLAASVVLGALVTATWLFGSLTYVVDYLTSFGYGAHTAEFNHGLSRFGPDAWLGMMVRFADTQVYLPHFLVMLATAAGMTLLLARRWRDDGATGAALAALRCRAFPLVVFAGSALAALASSRNQGSAFFAPIVVPLLILTGWLADRFDHRRATMAAAVGVALVAGVPLVDARAATAAPLRVRLPLLGDVRVTDGRGIIQLYERQGQIGGADRTEPLTREAGNAWLAVSRTIAAALVDAKGPDAVVAFGFRHRMVNTNTVDLYHLLRFGWSFGMRAIDPIIDGDSVADYAAWIKGDDDSTCILLTASGVDHGEFEPRAVYDRMAEAARRTGYKPIQSWAAPGDWSITMWRRIPPPETAQCGG